MRLEQSMWPACICMTAQLTYAVAALLIAVYTLERIYFSTLAEVAHKYNTLTSASIAFECIAKHTKAELPVREIMQR